MSLTNDYVIKITSVHLFEKTVTENLLQSTVHTAICLHEFEILGSEILAPFIVLTRKDKKKLFSILYL